MDNKHGRVFSNVTASVSAGIITILVGLLVVIGWKFDVDSFKTVVSGTISMKPNTALTFMLAGAALLLLHRPESLAKSTIRFIASIISAIGIISLGRYVIGWNFGFENLLFREQPGTPGTIYPGLMAFGTACNFIFLGLAFILLTTPRYKNRFIIRFLIIFSLSVSLFALLGYITGYVELAGPGSFTKMAINTAGLFVILCTGLLFSIPTKAEHHASVERRLFTGLTISIALVIFVSSLAIEGMNSLQRINTTNSLTDKTLDQLNDIIIRIDKIQSAGRKFILTGEEYYRKSHEIGVLHLSRILDTLKLGEIENSAIHNVSLIAKRLANEKPAISFNKLKELGPERLMILMTKENEITDSIRGYTTKVLNQEKQLMLSRNSLGSSLSSKTRKTIFTGIAIQLLLILFLFIYVKRDVAGRKRAEESLRQMNNNLESLVEQKTQAIQQNEQQHLQMLTNSPISICHTSLDGKVLFTNQAFADLMDYNSLNEVFLDKSLAFYKNPGDREKFISLLKSNGRVEQYELEMISKKSKSVTVLLNAWMYQNSIFAMSVDITDRKLNELKINNLNRIYRILSSVNETIIHTKSKQLLFDEACRIATEKGKFMLAWIGVYDELVNKVLPVASSGDFGDYFETANIDMSDEHRRTGVVAQTITTGTHRIALDIMNSPEALPWRDNAIKHGYKSLGCFPLNPFGKTIGAFMLYADTPYFFDEAGISLLDEIASDISFALEIIENEKVRLQIEDDNREVKAKLEAALASMSDAVFISDTEGKFIEVNDAFATFHRFKSKEECAKKFAEYPDILDVYMADGTLAPVDMWAVPRALRGEKGVNVEYSLRRKDTGETWIGAYNFSPIFNKAGKIIGSVVVGRDITEAKQAQKLLQESEERFRNVFENSPIGNSLTTPDGRLNVNKEFCNILGYPEEELSSKSFEEITHPDDVDESRLLVNTLLANKPETVRLTKRFIHKSGRIVWTDVRTFLQRDIEGHPLYFITSITDITELKKTIEELVVAKEKAEGMNRLKSNFLANMSHELRTPLIGILGYAEILSTELKEEDAAAMARTILTSGDRLKNTLNMILDFSKVEAEQIRLYSKQKNIIPLIQQCVVLFSEAAHQKKLSLSLEAESEEIYAFVDERLFVDLLNNLVKNGIVYTEKGTVTVKVSVEKFAQKEWVRIDVIDTGIGIDEKDRNLIFEEFRQASEGISRSFEGTGLGLTLSKKYAELMHGTITFESTVGSGSTFTIRLPLSDSVGKISDKHSEQAPLNLPVTKSNQRFSTLYVEDDDVSQMVISKILSKICTIECADTGFQALAMAAAKTYELVLVDINLGKGMDGIEVTKKLREMPAYKNIPIVAVTAYAMPGDREEFLAAGCTDYISKPFTQNELIGIIKRTLKL